MKRRNFLKLIGLIAFGLAFKPIETIKKIKSTKSLWIDLKSKEGSKLFRNSLFTGKIGEYNGVIIHDRHGGKRL